MSYREQREVLIRERREMVARYIIENHCTIKEAYQHFKEDQSLMDMFQQYRIGFSLSTLKRELDIPLKHSNPELFAEVRPLIDGNRNNVLTNQTMTREAFARLIIVKRDLEGKSFRVIGKELELAETSVIRIYKDYAGKIELTQEDVDLAKKSDMKLTPHIQDKVDQHQKGIEHQILSWAHYALETKCDLSTLSRHFGLEEQEVRLTLSELLPLLDYELYLSLQEQLGLFDEILYQTEQGLTKKK